MSLSSNTKIGLIALVVGGVAAGTLPLFFRDFTALGKGAEQKITLLAKNSPSKGTTESAIKDDATKMGTVFQKPLTAGELSPGERYKLYQAELQVFQATEEILAMRYRKEFLENYRKQKNLATIAAAEEDYTTSKAKVDDAELDMYLKNNKDNPRLAGKSDEERKTMIRQALEGRNRQNAIRSLMMEGKMRGDFAVSITPPVEPEIPVGDGGSPFLGPKDAPVSIVEFADYQCPYCARMVPALQNVVKKYAGKVRWVYRDFPLKEIHPNALPAAVAAKCAGEQGKYFEMHNKLFENYATLSPELYTKLAKELTLDITKFDSCQKNPAIVAEINANAEFGAEIGVNGTPAYFVNNKRITGGADEAEFSRLIDAELAKIAK